MRKADLAKNHAGFDAALTRYRAFMAKVLNAQRVLASPVEKRDIAESVVLRVCSWWEYFVDEHLVDCVNRDSSQLSQFFGVTIPPHPSKALCQALLFGDTYRDFKSVGDLKGFSKKVLPGTSNPFSAVSAVHAKLIDEVYVIRNYLSHYSFRAGRSLERLYQNNYKMTNWLEPGKFLVAYNGKRLWTYLDAFEGASSDMKATY